ncbi:MAG: LysM domain-containing protein [Gaiellaceae bacterium]
MAARVAAPLAFLVLATLGIVAIRSALNESPSTRPATTTVATTTPTETAATETTATTEGMFYRVQAGDTLESIASRSGTTVERLLELNPGIDPVALRIGQRIRVG